MERRVSLATARLLFYCAYRRSNKNDITHLIELAQLLVMGDNRDVLTRSNERSQNVSRIHVSLAVFHIHHPCPYRNRPLLVGPLVRHRQQRTHQSTTPRMNDQLDVTLPPTKFEHLALVSTRRRAAVLEFIKASAVESLARRRIREDPTHENLTTWTDAKNHLDDTLGKL